MTTTLRIEHGVTDFARWKQVFDSDPLDRKGSGVRAYRVMRASDDADRVTIDLDFDDAAKARAMEARLRELWNGPASAMLTNASLRLWELIDVQVL